MNSVRGAYLGVAVALVGCAQEPRARDASTADATASDSLTPDADTGASDETAPSDAPSAGETIADAETSPPDLTPILQRAPASVFRTCTARLVGSFRLPDAAYVREFVTTPEGTFLVANVERFDGHTMQRRVAVYPVGQDHSFGAALFESDPSPYTTMALGGAAGDGDLAFAWQPYVPTSTMSFARLGPAGELTVATKVIPGTQGAVRSLRILRAAKAVAPASQAGFTLIWQDYAGDGWTPRLAMRALDVAGDPAADVAILAPPEEGGATELHFDAAATEDGFLVVWDHAAPTSEIRLARFDAVGHPIGAPVTLSPSDVASSLPTLAPRRNGWLVAWRAPLTLMLAQLDTLGALVGAPVPLGPGPGGPIGSPHGQPRLASADDVTAVTWATPDDAPHAGEGSSPFGFVLVDPERLMPASDVLHAYHDGGSGASDGSIARVRLLPDGTHFFASYGIVFHAGSGDGATDFDCSAR